MKRGSSASKRLRPMKSPLLTTILVVVMFSFAAVGAAAQPNKPAISDDEKAEQIIQRALKLVGGDRYLQVKTVIGRCYFTDFRDGVSQVPMKFVDYIVYPDKERTEFSGGGARVIQTNFQDGGWIY